jgi:hypothetical protein
MAHVFSILIAIEEAFYPTVRDGTKGRSGDMSWDGYNLSYDVFIVMYFQYDTHVDGYMILHLCIYIYMHTYINNV